MTEQEAKEPPATMIKRIAIANLAKKASQGDKLSASDWRVLERFEAMEQIKKGEWMHATEQSLADAVGRSQRYVATWVSEGMPAGPPWNEILVRVWCVRKGMSDLKPPKDPFVAKIMELINEIVMDRQEAMNDNGEIRDHGTPKSWREEAAKQEAIKRHQERLMLELELEKKRSEVVSKEDAEDLSAEILQRCRRALSVTLQAMAEELPKEIREQFDGLMVKAEQRWQVEVGNDPN